MHSNFHSTTGKQDNLIYEWHNPNPNSNSKKGLYQALQLILSCSTVSPSALWYNGDIIASLVLSAVTYYGFLTISMWAALLFLLRSVSFILIFNSLTCRCIYLMATVELSYEDNYPRLAGGFDNKNALACAWCKNWSLQSSFGFLLIFLPGLVVHGAQDGNHEQFA